MKTTLKKIVKIIFLITPVIFMNSSFTQSENNTSIMKYNLNKKCIDFFNEIEKSYNCKIEIKEKELNVSEFGWSKMENNVPVIEIKNKAKEKEVIVIHEAYHLKLR
jgi:hypothetical protein